MTFLIWSDDDAQTDANASLANLNTEYGCPYEDENGYKMNEWCIVTNSDSEEDDYGFYAPEERLGKTQTVLDACLVGDYTEVANIPSDWVIIE